jgi:hypothetical protein
MLAQEVDDHLTAFAPSEVFKRQIGGLEGRNR